jgi:hypothetical protein
LNVCHDCHVHLSSIMLFTLVWTIV